MSKRLLFLCGALSLTLSGCAHLEFSAIDNGGVPFHPTNAFLVLACDKDGGHTATVLNLTDESLANTRWVKPVGGYGSNNLTAKFANGTLTEFGQQTDTKVPETITSLGSLATALAKPGIVPPDSTGCSTRILKYNGQSFSEVLIE